VLYVWGVGSALGGGLGGWIGSIGGGGGFTVGQVFAMLQRSYWEI